MSKSPSTENLIKRFCSQDAGAAEELFQRIYQDLKHLAVRQKQWAGGALSIQVTELVHETFLRIVGRKLSEAPANRGQFLSLMARVMRSHIVDEARRRAAQKRGGDLIHLEFDDCADSEARTAEQWILLSDLLDQLAAMDALTADIVQLRFFVGLTSDEIASELGVGRATVGRKWAAGRAWLASQLQESHL